jgi:hypothetical protein
MLWPLQDFHGVSSARATIRSRLALVPSLAAVTQPPRSLVGSVDDCIDFAQHIFKRVCALAVSPGPGLFYRRGELATLGFVFLKETQGRSYDFADIAVAASSAQSRANFSKVSRRKPGPTAIRISLHAQA